MRHRRSPAPAPPPHKRYPWNGRSDKQTVLSKTIFLKTFLLYLQNGRNVSPLLPGGGASSVPSLIMFHFQRLLKVIQQTVIHFVTDNRIFQFMINTRIIVDFDHVSLIIDHLQIHSIQAFSDESWQPLSPYPVPHAALDR